MNVLWMAPYPHPVRTTRTHQAPWLTALAQRLVHTPELHLTILSVSSAIPSTERFVHNGIEFIYVKVPVDKYDLLTGYQCRIRRVRRVLAEMPIKPDVIHIHGSELQYQVMAADLAVPKVLSVQGIMSEYLKTLPIRPDYRHLSWRVAEYYERQYQTQITHFICRTHWDTTVTHQQNAKAHIHQNWEMMREPFYKAIIPSKNPTNLFYVGGVNIIKGVVELLQAYDLFVQREPDLRLLIAGSGNKQEVLSIIKKLKLSHIQDTNVEHVGFLKAEQIWEAYHDALCLVHPSHIDNSPDSICEAQLAGLPVVASNVGGVSSLIEHNNTGLLTSLDPGELAEAIINLRQQPELRQNIAEAARRQALQRHDSAAIVAKTCSIYESVVSDQFVDHEFVS